MSDSLILIGASVRAAAFSALRANLHPWCADLFGDLDLRAVCPCTVLPPERYPEGFVDVVASGPPGAWMYTGGLENAQLALKPLWESRPLWGNGPGTVKRVRQPEAVSDILHQARLPVPHVIPAGGSFPERGRWLLKPYHGAGGCGVQVWNGKTPSRRTAVTHYLQEFVEGPSGAALFLGTAREAHLLGVTRQLVGETWLHASSFCYCGSIGPWAVPPRARATLKSVGEALVRETNLRGLFGIDFVLRDDVPWPVEVNPRYTASVEVLEHALALPALALHRDVFVGTPEIRAWLATDVVGKGIYFAPHTLSVPEDGPWKAAIEVPVAVHALPTFADVPPPGQVIRKGRPVVTFFSRAADENACREHLRQIAYNLDSLFGGGT
jgi:predicted ATP-grasp superfamily ATP-dependent carboligase